MILILVFGVKGGAGKSAIAVSIAYAVRLILDAVGKDLPVIVVDLEISNNFASNVINNWWPYSGERGSVADVPGVFEALIYRRVKMPLYRSSLRFGCRLANSAPPGAEPEELGFEARGLYLVPARNYANVPDIKLDASPERVAEALATLLSKIEEQFGGHQPAIFVINAPPKSDVLGDIPTAAILTLKKFHGSSAVVPVFEPGAASASEAGIIKRVAGDMVRDVIVNKTRFSESGLINVLSETLSLYLFEERPAFERGEAPITYVAGERQVRFLPLIPDFDSYYRTELYCIPALEFAASAVTVKRGTLEDLKREADKFLLGAAKGESVPTVSNLPALWAAHVARVSYRLLGEFGVVR